MNRFLTKYILISLSLCLCLTPARAEEKPQEAAEKAAVEAAATGEAVKTETPAEAPKAETPAETAKAPAEAAPPESPGLEKKMAEHQKASEKAFEAIKEIGKDLKDDDAKHFYMAYNNYNLIGTVKMVRTDVGNAVKECGKNNPDMKPAMDERYKNWNEAVAPVVKEAEANVNNMIVAQEYAEPAKIKKAFKALDEARKLTNEYADKKPVTTAEACKYLQDKMSDTQENLVSLLRATLISYGRAFPETPKETKADSKPKEEKNAEKPADKTDAAPPSEEKTP